MTKIREKIRNYAKPEKLWGLYLFLGVIGVTAAGYSFMVTPYWAATSCGGGAWLSSVSGGMTTATGMDALVHYATSTVVPQQTFGEITVSLEVLKKIAPCDFLVFGLGHDSLMWAGLNLGGKTLFLEEDPKWVASVLKDAPTLRAETVPYRTHLSEADELLKHYQSESQCWPANTFLRGNSKCRLALNMLSDRVYDTEWDMIMIDAPRGYYAKAPGRMAAIYSAAVMARNRKKPGNTHVFLHDVERKVEKTYAEKFLCRKYLVNGAGKLWHFEIPSAADKTADFC